MKIFKKVSFLVAFGILLALPASAAFPTLVPSCATGAATPSLACFLVLLGNVSKLILGITGSLALLFFIYGGFLLLTSGGNENQIKKGKEVLSRAIIGVIIIFGAYTAISFVTKGIGFKESSFKLPEQGLTEALNKSSSGTKDTSKTETTTDPIKANAPSTATHYCLCKCTDGHSTIIYGDKIKSLTSKNCETECITRPKKAGITVIKKECTVKTIPN